jgi:hypothetical protein
MRDEEAGDRGCLWGCLAIAAFGIAILLWGERAIAAALPLSFLASLAHDLRSRSIAGLARGTDRPSRRGPLYWAWIGFQLVIFILSAWLAVETWQRPG